MKFFPLSIIILFCVSNLSGQTILTNAEYGVYASVLKVLYKENRETYANKSEFVFLNETKVDPEIDLPSGKKYKILVAEFNRKNKTSAVIEKKFARGTYSANYYLVSQAEVDDFLEKGRIELQRRKAEMEKRNASDTSGSIGIVMGNYWTPFFQKYPESSGLHILSRVGFSGQLAMVQVRADHGWNGFSRTYILKRTKEKWRIITYSGSEWIS